MKTVSPIDFWLTLLCTPSSDKKMIIPTQEDQEKMSQPLTLLTNKNKKHFAKKNRASFGHPSQGVLRCSCQHSANASASAFDPKQPSLVLSYCFQHVEAVAAVQKCWNTNKTVLDATENQLSQLPTVQSLRWVDYQKKNIRIKKESNLIIKKINGSLLVEKLTKYCILICLIVHKHYFFLVIRF